MHQSSSHVPRSAPPRASRRPVAFLVAVCLVAPAVLLITSEGAEAATTRTLVIDSSTAKPTVPFKAFDGQAPKVFDINGDGDLEIIAQNDNQWVYVFDPRNGAILAELKTSFPSGWGARSMNAPEVAVLSGDGKVRVILANSAAVITSYLYEPAGSSASKLVFKKEWDRRLTDCHSNPGMDAKPVLADLDKDGRLEILAATEELGLYALRDNGALYWRKCIGGGNAEPTVGDLNMDSWPDVVFGSDAGIVTAMNGRTGGTMWTFDARARYNLGSGSIPVGVTIAQLDGVGGRDVVVGARDSHAGTDYSKNNALLLALSSTGSVLWARQDPAGNPLTYTHPIVVDADRDGQAEVYWADWNTVGHLGGVPPEDSWKTTGPANFYRYDRAGNLVWKQSLGTFWNNKDIPLADVDADGVQELLANGPGSNGHDGIWYLNSKTGAKEAWVSLYPHKLNRAPVVADLYGNGRMQWVAQVSPYASGAGHGLVIYDTGSPYSSAWPHLPYPPRGTGGSGGSTGGSTGSFAATFTVPSSVNEWWVQVDVQSNQAVSKVDVQVNGGSWVGLTKQSWGHWAKSFHVPAGSQVVFKATSSTGATATSSTYSWLGQAPPSGDFSATFKPGAVGNDWWVEVYVTANQPLAKVEAKVNSGPWVTLSKQDWGSWAKSLHAPNGSQVTFRATSTGGSVATSSPVTWP